MVEFFVTDRVFIFSGNPSAESAAAVLDDNMDASSWNQDLLTSWLPSRVQSVS